jgi:hypothetical protein
VREGNEYAPPAPLKTLPLLPPGPVYDTVAPTIVAPLTESVNVPLIDPGFGANAKGTVVVPPGVTPAGLVCDVYPLSDALTA